MLADLREASLEYQISKLRSTERFCYFWDFLTFGDPRGPFLLGKTVRFNSEGGFIPVPQHNNELVIVKLRNPQTHTCLTKADNIQCEETLNERAHENRESPSKTHRNRVTASIEGSQIKPDIIDGSVQ